MDLHVTNLPFKLKEGELRALFEQYGSVESVKIVVDHKLRQSKGYGFVTMPDEGEAKAAITALNEFEIQERLIKVSESSKKSDSKNELSKIPFWKLKKKPGQKLVSFDGDREPVQRKKRRGHGRGTTY